MCLCHQSGILFVWVVYVGEINQGMQKSRILLYRKVVVYLLNYLDFFVSFCSIYELHLLIPTKLASASAKLYLNSI